MDRNVLNGRRILVVEDDPLIAADLLQGLEQAGAEVAGPYGRVDDALRRLEGSVRFDGAVLDIDVSGEKVYRLVDRLRQHGTLVVFATGADAHDIPAPYRAIKRYAKPYQVEDVARSFVQLASPPTARGVG